LTRRPARHAGTAGVRRRQPPPPEAFVIGVRDLIRKTRPRRRITNNISTFGSSRNRRETHRHAIGYAAIR